MVDLVCIDSLLEAGKVHGILLQLQRLLLPLKNINFKTVAASPPCGGAEINYLILDPGFRQDDKKRCQDDDGPVIPDLIRNPEKSKFSRSDTLGKRVCRGDPHAHSQNKTVIPDLIRDPGKKSRTATYKTVIPDLIRYP